MRKKIKDIYIEDAGKGDFELILVDENGTEYGATIIGQLYNELFFNRFSND